MSDILDQGKTPEEWMQVFAARGIKVSARAIRAEARRLGACRILGNAMLLLPEHIDRIFAEPAPRRAAVKEPPDYRSAFTTDEAIGYLRRLQKKAKRKPKSLPPPKGS